MVSKCANPECAAPFLYFHEGKLFRVETAGGSERRRSLGQQDEDRKPLRRLEFFWLCDDCARNMTLRFDKETGVSVQRAHAAAVSAA